MIKLQVTHDVTVYNAAYQYLIGLLIRVDLEGPSGTPSKLEIGCKSITIVSRKDAVKGYMQIIFPIDPNNIDSILSRVEGTTTATVYALSNTGFESAIRVFSDIADEFTYDFGPRSNTVTLTLRNYFSIPALPLVEIFDYVSKRKLAYVGVNRYEYSVDPNTYKNYSVGTSFLEGSISGIVSEVTLKATKLSTELYIEVEA